ncbi:MAG: cbb3-type cytochrome c oxidase subunit I [Limisphaerales bacterium]
MQAALKCASGYGQEPELHDGEVAGPTQRKTATGGERRLSVDYTLTRRAMVLAVGSLLLAGCFSLLLIVGRLPVISGWISDAQFFKRCLVLHVDLALIVWFFAFAAALYSLIPADRSSNQAFRMGIGTAGLGVLAMIAGTMIPRTAPVLANYVPVIDNAIYVGGVALFFGGLVLCFINERLFAHRGALGPGRWDSFEITVEVAIALKTTAIAYAVAITCFLMSWASTPKALEPRFYYELLFWGGGHVLQVANVAAMLAVWLLLLSSMLKREILGHRAARILFALLLAPHLAAPLLITDGTLTSLYRIGFTRLMQFGIAPVVLIILGICIRRVVQAWREGSIGRAEFRGMRFVGFASSAALTLAGFSLGASIRNSTTMIPAHYHASIGAVTVVFMAMTYLLLQPVGLALPSARLQRLIPWQLALFGGGQVIFALGFALGGMHGLGRKTYSAEQHVRSAGELLGLGVMSFGGLIAVAGGLLFLFLALCARQRMATRQVPKVKINILARSNA